jgi:outer membrane immunogenic protein
VPSVSRFPLPLADNAGSLTTDGGAYGGQIGCDYQVNSWVFGIRGMWDGATLNGITPWVNFPVIPVDTTTYKLSSFGTLVGKLGYLVAPTVQLHGLGGVAWLRDRLTLTN